MYYDYEELKLRSIRVDITIRFDRNHRAVGFFVLATDLTVIYKHTFH